MAAEVVFVVFFGVALADFFGCGGAGTLAALASLKVKFVLAPSVITLAVLLSSDALAFWTWAFAGPAVRN